MSMDDLSNIIAGISAGVAFISAIFTGFMFYRYDKRLKEQEQKINDFQLKEYARKEIESKKASLRAEVFCINGEWKIMIQNEGVAPARNVRLLSPGLTPEEGRIKIMNESILPYPILNRNDRFYLDLCLMEFHDIKPVIQLFWDDDCDVDRNIIQALCLC